MSNMFKDKEAIFTKLAIGLGVGFGAFVAGN
jgi:hypothetical protein